MASPGITIQEIADHCGVREAELDREVTSDKLHKISGYLSSWKRLAPKLNITKPEVEDIEKDIPKADMQRIGFLEKWHQKMSIRATYRALMEALLEIDRADDANKVCQVLKSTLQPAVREKKLTTPPVSGKQRLDKDSEDPKRYKSLLNDIITAEIRSRQSSDNLLLEASFINSFKFCREHGQNKVELYCETCKELICCRCAIKGGRHHSHEYEDLNKAVKKHRQDITGFLEPVENRLARNKEALEKLERRCKELTEHQTAVEANLHQAFTKFRVTLDTRETELVSQLRQSTQEEQEKLAVQRDQLKTTQDRLTSCLTNMKKSLETERPEDVLANRTKVDEQVKELTSMPPPGQLEPMIEATFSYSRSLSAHCHKYMQIKELGLQDSSEEESGLEEPLEKESEDTWS